MKSYKHFTLEERESLYLLKKLNKSVTEIAKELGRSKSTISRELKRNQNYFKQYNPVGAQRKYRDRRLNCKRKYRILRENDLKEFIITRLNKYWSPEMISIDWNNYHPNRCISHSTIYFAIKLGFLPNITAKTHLRRKGNKKHKSSKYATIRAEHRIDERPAEANLRTRIGDWEGDLICGAIGKGCLVTFTDRKTRLLLAKRIPERSAATVAEAMIDMLKDYPVKTITLDNGPEFAQYKSIEKALNTTVYFAYPHSPWQRGTNENINDCLRFFYPKGTNFHTITDESVALAVDIINNRPRKVIGFCLPTEFFCCT